MKNKKLYISLIVLWLVSAGLKLITSHWVINIVFLGLLLFGFLKLVVIIKTKKLWKFRNKLIFSGIFFIVIPIILLTLFFLTVINVLIAQYGTVLFENLMNEQLKEIEKVSQYYLDNLKKGDLQIQDFKSRLENMDLDFINFKILILKKNKGIEEILFCFPEDLIKYRISSFSFSGYCKVDDLIHHGVFKSEDRYSIMILFPLTKKYLNQISQINDFRIDFGGNFTGLSNQDQSDLKSIPWEFSYKYLDFDEKINGMPKKKIKKFYLHVNLKEIFRKLFSDRSIYSHGFIQKFFYLIIVVFGLVILLSFLIGIIIVRNITASLNQLTTGMRRVGEDDYKVIIKPKSDDQIGYLTNSFNKLIKELHKYIPQTDQSEKDLKLTRDLQLELLPKNHYDVTDFELAAENIPSGKISNYFYDYYHQKKRSFTVYLFDVLTKEISAVLPMIYLKGMISSLEKKNEDLNNLVKKSEDSVRRFLGDKKIDINMFCFRLNLDKNIAQYISLGDIMALHFNQKDNLIHQLVPGKSGINEGEISYFKDDIFIFFSNSLLKIQNRTLTVLTIENIKEIILKSHSLSAKRLKQKILDFILDFSDNISRWDDLNFVVVKVK